MSPHVSLSIALLLVTVWMVRAYPQSLNKTAAGYGESGQSQQHYASGARTSSSETNSGPSIDCLSQPVQDLARNQQRQIPTQEFPEPPRRFGSDNRVQPQKPHNPVYRSEQDENNRRALLQQISNSPRGNQQNVHFPRSIQTRNENVPNSNDDHNGIVKQRTVNVNTNHGRTPPMSRSYLRPPAGGQHADTRRISEELNMEPQPSQHSQTRIHTTPGQGSNRTLVPEKFPQNSSSSMSRTSSSRSSGAQEDIVFPDQKLTIPRIGKGGPKCAKGLTFCEDIEGYPNEQISNIIRKESSLYKSVFGTDVKGPDVINRISPEEELCRYEERIAYPKVGQTKDEKWAWIANTDDFKQGVRVEVCQNNGSECQLISNVPMGFKTECRQKHIYRRLLSLSNEGAPSTEEFLFPSCCVCSVKKDENK